MRPKSRLQDTAPPQWEDWQGTSSLRGQVLLKACPDIQQQGRTGIGMMEARGGRHEGGGSMVDTAANVVSLNTAAVSQAESPTHWPPLTPGSQQWR